MANDPINLLIDKAALLEDFENLIVMNSDINKKDALRMIKNAPEVGHSEIPAVDDKTLVRIAGKAYMQSGEDKGCYSAKAMSAAITALRPYLRTTEPVSVSLEKCKWEISKIFSPDGVWNIEEGMKMKRAAKAVLDAAGVSYVD